MAKFTLYDRAGKKYETSDKTEAVRLKSAHGYTDKAPKSQKSDTK